MAQEEGRVTGSLCLKGISLSVELGVLPGEKVFHRGVLIDLSFSGPASPEPCLDYGEACSCVASFEGLRFDFIEQLAHAVHSALCERWPGVWSVTVRKPFPPVCLHTESAEYTVAG